MNYQEKIVEIKYDVKTGTIELQSHNTGIPDEIAKWWTFGEHLPDLHTKLLNFFEKMDKEEFLMEGYTGAILRFRYAYEKYKESLEKDRAVASIENIRMFELLLKERDSGNRFKVRFGENCYVDKLLRGNLHYSYGEENAKLFTKKQVYLFQKDYDDDRLSIEAVQDDQKDKETQRLLDIIEQRYYKYIKMIGKLGNTESARDFNHSASAKAIACVQILSEFLNISYETVEHSLRVKFKLEN